MRRYLDVLNNALSSLTTPWQDWRTAFVGTPAAVAPVRDPLAEALELAHATALDKAQRALDYPAPGVQDLHDLRLEVRDAIKNEPPESPLKHVRPWVWTPKSLGQPMSESGRDRGAELRLSYYQTATE